MLVVLVCTQGVYIRCCHKVVYVCNWVWRGLFDHTTLAMMFLKVTGKRFAHATGPLLVNTVAGAPVRFFPIALCSVKPRRVRAGKGVYCVLCTCLRPCPGPM